MKTPASETIFNKVALLQSPITSKKTSVQVFFCEFFKIFRNTCFGEQLGTLASVVSII